MPEIVALGEPLLEFAAEEPGHLRSVGTFRRGWGGDTSNFAVAAARLGASSGYLTRLGHDEFGRCFLELWEREGVDASAVVLDPEAPTGIYFISRDRRGAHEFTYYREGSAASRMSPADLDPGYLGSARVFHTSGISQAISDSARATVEAAIELAREREVLVAYDANVRTKLQPPDRLRQTFTWAANRADVVFVSEEDLRSLYPGRATEEVLEELGDVLMVVVKLGAQGCLVAPRGQQLLPVPPFPIELVDASGAGDAFAAAFLVAWHLEERDPAAAARWANAVGALTASGLGAVEPLPRREEVDRFLEERERLPRTSEVRRLGAR